MKNVFKKAISLIEQDDWHGAHDIVNNEPCELGSLLHGYLHRIEGDMSNARYWYRRAGQPMLDNTSDQELARIKHLIGC
jgi:hypothetical protein